MTDSTMVMVSGGFDPLHVGHIDLFESAAMFGDLFVIAMPDAWLIRKKGYCVMKSADRGRIIAGLDCVEIVYLMDDESYSADETVEAALRLYQPDIFCNGGDRTEANEAEHIACVELGIVEAFNVGGKKRRSSSALISRAMSPNVVNIREEEEN